MAAAMKISAHTTPRSSRAASVEMRKPMPTIGVPKNSATMAPISASVAFSFSALNTNGRAEGRRSLSSIVRYPAA